jgi:hypothetical protein
MPEPARPLQMSAERAEELPQPRSPEPAAKPGVSALVEAGGAVRNTDLRYGMRIFGAVRAGWGAECRLGAVEYRDTAWNTRRRCGRPSLGALGARLRRGMPTRGGGISR